MANRYHLKTGLIALSKQHFDFFFSSSQAVPFDLPDEVTTPIRDYHQNGFNAALCKKNLSLTPVYIDFLAEMCNFLSHQYHSTSQQSSYTAKDHPIQVFHRYVEFAVTPIIEHNSANLSPAINHLLVFAFSFGTASCRDALLQALPQPTFISYLLENKPHILSAICDHLSQQKLPSLDRYDFLTELNQQILNAPNSQYLRLLQTIIPILEQDPSKQMVASFSATYLLVTLYTNSNLDTSTLLYYAHKITPPTLFSQSIEQILYLLAISSPSNLSAKTSPLFTSFVGYIAQHCTSEYYPVCDYTHLTTQYAISHGRIDVLQFLHNHMLTYPTKSDIQLIMRNNKSQPYSLSFFKQLNLSPEELATNILQSSNSNSLSIFSYLDHLLQILHLLPDTFSCDYMDLTFSALIQKLGPTFSEYDRLDPQGDYSDSFLKLIDTLASKGARCENLPSFFPKSASFYLNKVPSQQPPTTTYRLNKLLHASLSTFFTQNSVWLIFSPFASGKTYRTTILNTLSFLHNLDQGLLKKHAFAIRHMLLWQNLSWFSYLYCCVSSRYAAAQLASVSQHHKIHASCLRYLASHSQAYYLPLINSLTKNTSPSLTASTLPKLPIPGSVSKNHPHPDTVSAYCPSRHKLDSTA